MKWWHNTFFSYEFWFVLHLKLVFDGRLRGQVLQENEYGIFPYRKITNATLIYILGVDINYIELFSFH